MTGAEFREARYAAGLSLTKTATALGVTVMTVTRWQRGAVRIPSDAADRIRELAQQQQEREAS